LAWCGWPATTLLPRRPLRQSRTTQLTALRCPDTEAVYRSLCTASTTAPSLAEMLPTWGSPLHPTLARSGLHLGIVDTKPDPRIAALDARVAANAQACADPALRSSWIGSLQTLSEALQCACCITVPGEADVAQKRGELTEAELELRLRLQADAGRRLGHWHRRLALPCCSCSMRGSSQRARHLQARLKCCSLGDGSSWQLQCERRLEVPLCTSSSTLAMSGSSLDESRDRSRRNVSEN